jgi:hypothetical protein
MRTPLLSLLMAVIGCSASSSPSTAVDAGGDASTQDGGDAACFPFCSGSSSGGSSGSGSGGDDGGGDAQATCAQLSASIAQLQGPAQSCNPHLPSQCGGTAQGICCAITVSAGNDTAINDYESAVTSYTAQCNPTCMGSMCPTVPSQQCVSSTTGTGACQ